MTTCYMCPKCGEASFSTSDAERWDLPEIQPAEADGDDAVCGACGETSPLVEFDETDDMPF